VPEYAFAAISGVVLAGIAGFHTDEGSFTGGFLSGSAAYRELVSRLGILSGSRAALVISLYERSPTPGELLMDGIAVRHDFRGQGIGSQLLNMIYEFAASNGFDHVRLEVVDTNPRAQKLYERVGFQAVKSEQFPYLRKILGFGGYTTMIKKCDAEEL
jgi:ribosomal protein S18 acetylase RimI-like enzyme